MFVWILRSFWQEIWCSTTQCTSIDLCLVVLRLRVRAIGWSWLWRLPCVATASGMVSYGGFPELLLQPLEVPPHCPSLGLGQCCFADARSGLSVACVWVFSGVPWLWKAPVRGYLYQIRPTCKEDKGLKQSADIVYGGLQKIGIRAWDDLCWFSFFSRLWPPLFQLSGFYRRIMTTVVDTCQKACHGGCGLIVRCCCFSCTAVSPTAKS